MPRSRLASSLLPMLTLMLALSAAAAEGYWQAAAGSVAEMVSQAEAAALAGDGDGAKRRINEAYFGRFEESSLEIAIRREISIRRAAEIEKMFADMRKAVTARDNAAVARVAAELRAAVAKDAKALDDAKVTPASLRAQP